MEYLLFFDFSNLKDDYVVLAGDGQMDSPGHSAKHCVYSVMDATNYYILHAENIDVRTTQHKSTVMEKTGCELALTKLMERISLNEFVSDANSQIVAMLSKAFASFLYVHFLHIH